MEHQQALRELENNLYGMRINNLVMMGAGLKIIKSALTADIPYEVVADMLDRMILVVDQEKAVAETQRIVS